MTTLIDNEHIKVSAEEIVLPNGERIRDFYLVEKRDYVAVVPVLEDRNTGAKILLVEQYRPGLAQSIWNIPMGFIDEGETAEQAARRELLEETGHKGTPDLMAVLAPVPSFYTAVCHLYIAHQCKRVDPAKLDREIQHVELLTWRDAWRRVHNSKGADMTSVVGLLFAKEKHAL